MCKKILLLILTCFFLLNFYRCKKCKQNDYYSYAFLPDMESYFGVYKENNWWVYKNQDSTKTDSMYIVSFNEIINKDKNECIYWPERSITIYSKNLGDNSGHINVHYASVYNESSFVFSNVSTYNQNTNNTGVINTYYTNTPIVFDSLIVGNKKFYNIIYFNNDPIQTLFAKNVGLIRFINNADTFSLKSFHIN